MSEEKPVDATAPADTTNTMTSTDAPQVEEASSSDQPENAEANSATQEQTEASAAAESNAEAQSAESAAPSETKDSQEPPEPPEPPEPDEITPFIDKAKETIQQTLEGPELNDFLRAHIKPHQEEWDTWTDSAKVGFTHMLTAQLLQRKAAATQIGIGNKFKLPKPSANTTLMESLKESQVKQPRYKPALLIPPNLRPKAAYKPKKKIVISSTDSAS